MLRSSDLAIKLPVGRLLPLAASIAFSALLIVHLIPIWAFRYFPSQDGPSHIANASALLEYFTYYPSIFHYYYELNYQPDANWLGHLLLAALMYLTPLFAEKILLTGHVILFVCSVFYAVRAVNPENELMVLAAFPFIYAPTLHMGFYSFSYSVSCFFLAFGYYYRHREDLQFWKWMSLAFLCVVLYLFHIFSLAIAGFAVAILGICLAIEEAKSPGSSWRSLGLRLALPATAFVPAVLLVFVFLSGKEMVLDLRSVFPFSAKRFIWNLTSYGPGEVPVFLLLSSTFLALLAYLLIAKSYHRNLTKSDGLLVVVVALCILYVWTPRNVLGGDFIQPRFALYIVFILILWFAGQRLPTFGKWMIIGVSIISSVVLLGLHSVKYSEINAQLEEYTSGLRFIEPNTTLLYLRLGRQPEGVDPFRHAAGLIAVKKRVVILTNYEANTKHFPLRFKDYLNPYTHIGDLENLARPIAFLSYPDRTGAKVNYVLLWGREDGHRNPGVVADILRQLETGYTLIHTSPTGMMRLYRAIEFRSQI